MKPAVPAIRLRLDRIETKPKPVFAAHFQDFANVGRDPALRCELDAIIDSIEAGSGVPADHYRSGIGRDDDALLRHQGIMHLHLGGKHLHLGGKNSDTLVFLIQYDDRVVLLETNTHMHFRTQPAGRNILALHQTWLTELERELALAATALAAAATAAEQTAAEQKRTKTAAAIAAFKSKAGLK